MLQIGPLPPARLYHGSGARIEEFRAMSHFGDLLAAEDRLKSVDLLPRRPERAADVLPGAVMYPVALHMRRPLKVPDFGNNTMMDLAFWLEKEAPESTQGLYHKTVMAVIDNHRQQEEGQPFLQLCGKLGFFEPMKVYRDPDGAKEIAQDVTNKDVYEALQDQFHIDHGPGWATQRCVLPVEIALERGRPQNLVANAVRALGFDGLVYDNAYENKGTASWTILSGHQVKFLLDTPVQHHARDQRPRAGAEAR